MSRDSGTRSGLLWEVERLLKETPELPQVLLMENVKQVIGKKNIKDFAEWVAFLDKLGYKSFWKVLNATDFAIPQNRERCFMVSILGDYFYSMPNSMPLEKNIGNVLEENVSQKYYLGKEVVEKYKEFNKKNEEKGNGFRFSISSMGGVSKTILTKSGSRPCDNFIYQRPHGYNKGGIKEIAPTITTSAWAENNYLVKNNDGKTNSKME